ncbi:MAG: T9SS type A sorting domain-containing protein, partial [Cryomorphaceae bacterium]
EDTFEISQPDSLFALINSNANSSCYNNILSGELGAIAIGGTAPYTYSWSNGADSTSIVNVGAGYYSVTISDSNGCFAMASDTIVKDTFPIAGFEPLGAHCINDDSISLGGGSPLGGSYFGSHVFNGAFATSSSLSGQFEVYYVYQDANGCADTASSFIQIDSIPIVSFDSLPVACVNIGALPLSYGSPMGGVYFGNGVVGDTFYPTITDTGSFELGYYVTTEGGCSDTAYQAIVVSEYPALTYFEVNALCGNALPVFLTSGIPSGGTHFGEGVTNGMFNPSSTGIGNTVVGYFYEHICGVDTAFDTLNILPFPSIDVDESFGICINDSAYIEANETYHSYLWNRSDTSQTHLVLGADLGIGSTNRQLIVSNEQGCSDSTVFTLVVSDTQQISISDTAICLDQELYLAAPSGGNLTYTWSNGNVSQEILAYDGSLTRPEPRTLGLEVINAEGCISQDSIQISVIDCDTLRPEGYFTVYPNPSNEKFTLELYLAYDQEITAVVYDVSGKILDQQVLALARGKNWVDYTTERFGAGVIIIRFSLDDRVLATRVVIL